MNRAVPQRTDRREHLVRTVRLLAAATITYNVIEAVIALAAGTVAGSGALLGFGLDSVIEVASAVGLSWQFAARDHDRRADRERTALRITALSFVALAIYLVVDSVRSLGTGHPPQASTVGIVLAAASLVVMPVLSAAQRRAGRSLGSASAVADSKQTLVCTYLSAVLLVGLAANAVLGWWWADPAAALVIAALAGLEGYRAWRGESCCAPVVDAAAGCGCGPACACPAG